MAEGQANEVMKKLEQGIQESREMIRQRVMELARDYFTGSVETVKQAMEESRSTLEGLPEQLPGADEGAFRMMFETLMNNYDSIEETLDAAKENIANLDTEEVTEQGNIDATDAARREAAQLGVDLTEVEGTGTGGRVIISDVMEAAQKNARNKAEELGVNLEAVAGSGFNGLVTADDVIQFAESAGIETAQALEEPEIVEEEEILQAVVDEPVGNEAEQVAEEAEIAQIAVEEEAARAEAEQAIVAEPVGVEAGQVVETGAVQTAEEEETLRAAEAEVARAEEEEALRMAAEARALRVATEAEAAHEQRKMPRPYG